MANLSLMKFTNILFRLFLCVALFSICYVLGTLRNFSSSAPLTHIFSSPVLDDFESHYTTPPTDGPFFDFCPSNFTNYCPCNDRSRGKLYATRSSCPEPKKKPRCLVPKPEGYKKPFSWPKSRDQAWFKNVPFKKLTVDKKSQNWVRLEGDLLVFPGGGTSFSDGVKGYVEAMSRLVPLKSGHIRTVLDVGCGVASFGAHLMDYNILTMSIAPLDAHEAQLQFALERGVPAMFGKLKTHRLPFPARSFDMAHCSRCLVEWTNHDGLYLIEIDRVLRPGGYWLLSGPPINWKNLRQEQGRLEDLARRLCWKKITEKGRIAAWQKPINHMNCEKKSRTWKSPHICTESDPDDGWYRKMQPCIAPLPHVTDIGDIAGGPLAKWPQRMNICPPRIRSKGTTIEDFNGENELWRRRVGHYGVILKSLFGGKYRNVMDMNAGIGGFAAALVKYPMWVMNVVPPDAKSNLSIVYERGFIGTYMDWCESFSTYPRTYDLIHAHGIFSLYLNKCDNVDILLEMYRILRPDGAVIIRDHVDIIAELKMITDRMKWEGKILHSEHGPSNPEKILLIANSE